MSQLPPGFVLDPRELPPGFVVDQAAPEEDQYRRAAREDLQRAGTGTGRLQRQIMQGLTFGAADEIAAGLMTPFEMARRGTFNPVEAYNYAKAREDLALEQDRQRDGIAGSVAEIGAGVATGLGAANAGLTAARFLTPASGLGARVAAGAADGAAYGALTGALTNNGSERLSGAATGAAFGGVLGGALPAAVEGVSRVASPVVSNISARINPERYADRQVARALSESGRQVDDVIGGVQAAAREGQGVYTVADELGNPGQRLLSVVGRNPGAGRTQAVEFLDARQAEQGRRLAGSLDDALGSAQTARQLEAAREAARRAEANVNYGAARAEARPVDVSSAIALADERLTPGINAVVSSPAGITDDSVAGIVSRARSYLTDGRSAVSDFNRAFAAKTEIDSLIERATNAQRASLIPIRNELDDALAAASGPYAQARDAYRQASKGIEAIQTGRDAAQRGRFEDTIPAFRSMSPNEQVGYRVGYGDELVRGIQGAAEGVNKARPFTSDALRAELATFSRPGQADLLQRRIGRENRMFETRNTVTGGSKTADNLADNQGVGVSSEVVGNIIAGNLGTAARNAIFRAGSALNGNTPQVREALARRLLARGDDASGIRDALENALKSEQGRRRVIEILMRGGIGGGAALPGAVNIPATNGR